MHNRIAMRQDPLNHKSKNTGKASGRFRGPGTLVFWIVSYAAMLALPLLIYGGAMLAMTNDTQQSMYEGNVAVVQQMQRLLDSRVEEALSFQFHLCSDTTINALFPITMPLGAQSRYNLWKVSENIAARLKYSALFTGGYLYLWPTDTALCNGSIYNLDLTLRIMHEGDDLTAEAWREVLRRSWIGNLYACPKKDGSFRILLLSNVPYSSYFKTSATMVLSLDDSYYLSNITDINNATDSAFLLLDEQDRVITANRPLGALPGAVRFDALQGDSGYFTADTDQGLLLVSYASSLRTGWKCLSLTPLEALGKRQRLYWNIVLVSTLLCTVAGLAMAVFLARRRLAFFDGLLEKVRRGLGNGEIDRMKPVMLDQFLDEMIRSRKELDTLVRRQNDAIRSHTIERLLRGAPGGEASLVYEALGVRFDNPCFFVVLLFINQTLEIGPGSAQREALLLAQAERVKEAMASRWTGVALTLDGMSAVLFNLAEPELPREAEGQLKDILRDCQEALYGQDLYLGASISAVHQGIEHLRDAYLQALGWANYALLAPPAKDALYNAREFHRSKKRLFLTAPQEEMLCATITSGQADAAERLVDELCGQLADGAMDPGLAKCFFYDLLAGILRCARPSDLPDEIEQEIQALDQATAFADKVRLLRAVARGVAALCGRRDSERDFIVKIMDTLKEHYTDPSFNVARLADLLHRNASYLSKYFKDVTGVGLYDYLTRMRIEKAKELIDNSDAPISTLIGGAGFENVGSFIRVFKKYEGMTPGSYQKSLET